jgi:hypothetical protein
MTAVLAAIGRAALYVTLGLAYLVWILWAALGHTGLALVAWLAVVFVTIAGSGAALEWLGERRRKDAAYPEDWQEQGWCCRECAVTAWNGMSLELRREFARRRDG